YGRDPGAAYYAPGDFTPVIPVTYWAFRLMIGLGLLAALIAIAVLWGVRGDRVPTGRVWLWAAVALPLLPVAANSFGWILTEMGRQPWSVFGLMTTANAVSPGVSAGDRLTLVRTVTVLYGVLSVVELGLMLHFI